MPSSVPIAALVLGGVLVLVALVGGNFKLFGAEVGSAPSGCLRVVAFVLGCLLLAVGLEIRLPVPAASADPSPGTADAPPPRSKSVAPTGDRSQDAAIKNVIGRALRAEQKAVETGDDSELATFFAGSALTGGLGGLNKAADMRAQGYRLTGGEEVVAVESITLSDDGTEAQVRAMIRQFAQWRRGSDCSVLPPFSFVNTYYLRRVDGRWVVEDRRSDVDVENPSVRGRPRPC